MRLTPELAHRVGREYSAVRRQMEQLNLQILSELAPTLRVPRAREYLEHGIGRRLKVIGRCIDNIFAIFPPERTDLLNSGELSDIQINLHAFVINIYGLLDNVAWVYVLEKGLESSIEGGRAGVGLFSKKTQEHFAPALRKYLTSDTLRSWYADYAKNYRDALAHRIPLYVPPFTVTNAEGERWRELDAQIWAKLKAGDVDEVERLTAEKRSIGTICAAFMHSYSDSDASRPVLFHGQVICDAMTVLEILGKVSEDVKVNGWRGASVEPSPLANG